MRDPGCQTSESKEGTRRLRGSPKERGTESWPAPGRVQGSSPGSSYLSPGWRLTLQPGRVSLLSPCRQGGLPAGGNSGGTCSECPECSDLPAMSCDEICHSQFTDGKAGGWRGCGSLLSLAGLRVGVAGAQAAQAPAAPVAAFSGRDGRCWWGDLCSVQDCSLY